MPMIHKASRRAFLQTIGAVSALTAAPSLEYIGTRTSIDVFHRRIKIQSIPSQNPSFLTLDKTRKFLFAVNEIAEYQGLPAGSVESYALHPLTLISRQSLSLSATMPRHLAIAPDGQHMVVAAYGGGAYNVLPIKPDGTIGPVTQIIKEIGRGPDPEQQTTAHPHSLLFHDSGQFLITTDFGADRINVFQFTAGRLTRLQQIQTPPGSGPAELTINPNGTRVFVTHQITPHVACYQFHTQTGSLTRIC
jgi:6-phosphogluconolactonase (cycloisomerase 2 family)